jgi:hypothetical protein
MKFKPLFTQIEKGDTRFINQSPDKIRTLSNYWGKKLNAVFLTFKKSGGCLVHRVK